jgi:hypothetical protein
VVGVAAVDVVTADSVDKEILVFRHTAEPTGAVVFNCRYGIIVFVGVSVTESSVNKSATALRKAEVAGVLLEWVPSAVEIWRCSSDDAAEVRCTSIACGKVDTRLFVGV